MSYTVYRHTGPTGKVYIGITSQKPENRWGVGGCGYRYNTYFWRAIQKYGWEAFTHEIIAQGLTKEKAAQVEVELIARHSSTDPAKGYNHSTGGEKSGAGARHTAEAKLKIAAANKGKTLSIETRKKVSASRKGWHPGPETRARMAEASKGRPSPRKGKKLDPETLERLRSAAERKPVKNLDTGEIFPSIQGAARALGLHAGAIWATCNGKQKTHGGFRWAYGEVIT